jgi:hypothetical protein
MAYTDNGPRAGRNRGRFRNTLLNNASKAAPPPVSPESAVAYGGQIATAQMTLADKLAALRAQTGLVRGQFQMDKAGVQANAIAGMASAVNSSLDRNMVGSTVDTAGRVGVLAEKASGMQAAIQAKIQGMLGVRTSRIQAANDYYTQLYDIQARKAAEQATLANQAFLNDLVMRMMDEQGPGGGNDRTKPVETTTPYQANELMTWLQDRLNAGRM